jgi:hypothetical protein
MTEDLKKKKSERVMVYVRVRPISDDELRTTAKESVVDKLDGTHVSINSKKDSEKKTFSFDSVFDHSSNQKEVYNKIGKPVVDCVLQGYNGTILAYGQTGTGKTHTMIGGPGELKGVIPRCMKEIFTSIKTSESHSYKVRVAFLQLYMEVLQDLIKPDPNNPVRIREDSEEGIYLAGLHWSDVSSVSDCMNLLALGDKNRNVASTSMNANSSRSHAVYMVKIEKRNKTPKENFEQTSSKFVDNSMTKSTLYLVDLAGSERVSKTKVSGTRLDEAKNINLALLALGNCIQALADGKSKYIPFRDSKLTRLLEDSLGGNSKTSLIVTIGPSSVNMQESISSLNFGSRAMKIQNTPELNIKVDYKALCDRLQAELDKFNDKDNIKNIDFDKLVEENYFLKQSIETLTTEKIQLEITLEELKKGADCSIVEGSNEEFQKIKRYFKAKLDKQEADHRKFLQEVDKTLLDQEEQINSMKNLNYELENNNKQLNLEIKRLMDELEHERNDRDLRIGQMMNEIEDLKVKLQMEKSNYENTRAEMEKMLGNEIKKSNSANTLQPIQLKPNRGPDLNEKVKQFEVMIANMEIELGQYEEKYNLEVADHKKTKSKFETEAAHWKENERKMEAEINKLKKQQAKLIKAFKSLEKKSESEIKNLQDELEKQSELSKREKL